MGVFLTFWLPGYFKDLWDKFVGSVGSGSGSEGGGVTAVPELDASQLGVALALIVGGMLIIHSRRRLAKHHG